MRLNMGEDRQCLFEVSILEVCLAQQHPDVLQEGVETPPVATIAAVGSFASFVGSRRGFRW